MARKKEKMPVKVYLVVPKGMPGPVAYASWSRTYARRWAKFNGRTTACGYRVIGPYMAPEQSSEGKP